MVEGEIEMYEIISNIRSTESEIRSLSSKKNELLKELAQRCPRKVGDIVTLSGYSYTGKQGRVEEIVARSGWGDQFEWVLYCSVIKKDGTPGLNRAKIRYKIEE